MSAATVDRRADAGGFAPSGGPQVDDVLGRLYLAAPGDVGAAGRGALAAMRAIDARLPRDAQRKIVPYQAEQGVNYDLAGDLGRPLRTVAQLAKMEIGLEFAAVDIGGWDTHEYQAGRFRNAVERLSNGLSGFYADMARFHDRLVIVVLSEFGRRLRSNKSNGTDHGRAGVMAVLGGAVAGGRMVGPWPGLAADRLDDTYAFRPDFNARDRDRRAGRPGRPSARRASRSRAARG